MNASARPAPLSGTGRVTRFGPLLAVLVIFAVAIGCALTLQYSTHLDWSKRLDTEVVVAPLDVAVIVVLITAVWALIGRLWWSLGLVSVLTIALAAINRTKIELRREPLYPGDHSFLGEAGSLLGMVDVGAAWRIVPVVLVVLGAAVLIGKLGARWFPRPALRGPDGRLDRRVAGGRLIALVLSGGLLIHATQFNEPGNLWRALYDKGATWEYWSQVHNYRTNGFVAGLLYNMPIEAMDRPDGYDQEAMGLVRDRYVQRADRINAGRDGSLEDVNVVIVLSESFTDPAWLDDFTLADNPIPATQQVMEQSIAGRMYANSYGGGTATMEFESLTGQTVGLFRPQVSSPYQMFVADNADYPSMVGAFKGLGHHTVAIHPYNLHMYKRTQVYRTLGFDQVIDENSMQSSERIATSRYISDASAFGEVLHQVDDHDDAVFVNLVTMQNHGAYEGSYPDPIASDIDDPALADRVGQYTRGLAHTDAALSDFLTELQQRDETTIVVFYGDHQPGIYDEQALEMNGQDALFQTPFFVWNSDTNETQQVAGVTPAMFLPLVHEAADAPVSPYVALLDDVRHAVPVIQHSRMLDAEGRPVDPENLDDATRMLLDDLRMTQYDFSVGPRYAVESMWPGALGEPTSVLGRRGAENPPDQRTFRRP